MTKARCSHRLMIYNDDDKRKERIVTGMKSDPFQDKEICITGGTGSLGRALVKLLITKHRPGGIRIFSRDEVKQWQMRRDVYTWLYEAGLPGIPIAFFIGDVRDIDRLKRAFVRVDIVLHTAALKQVSSCEENPREAIKTNVEGACNILEAAIDCNVEKVMNISTDKAVLPCNFYGATKMVAEKLFVHGNIYTGGHTTKLSCCRYGNVIASRGSLIQVFKDQIMLKKPLTITHPEMTRFWITLPKAAKFILDRITTMQGGEVFVPKMKSMKVSDMAQCLWFNTYNEYPRIRDIVITGIRQGEKLHEMLIHENEYTHEYKNHYVILPHEKDAKYGIGKKLELDSFTNTNGYLNQKELLSMLQEEI